MPEDEVTDSSYADELKSMLADATLPVEEEDELDQGDHEVPLDLLDIHVACEEAGVTAAEFAALGDLA